MIHIELNQEEILQGAIAGVVRMTNALGRGNNTINSPDLDRIWQFHIEGALAEMSVAKAYNKYWSSGDVNKLDIGSWEIRNTPRPDGDLVIRQRDVELKKMDKYFFLVRGRFGKYDIIGFIKGADGLKDEWFRDPTGKGRPKAWFVPEKQLIKAN